MRVILVRHGDTTWTGTGQHTGHTDLPLTDKGRSEALSLRRSLQPLDIQIVLTSPLQRARQTCDLSGLGSNARVDADLREWDYGAFEGETTPEICAHHPGWTLYKDGCVGGESVEKVTARAERVLLALRQLEGVVALFSHGQFLRVLALRWMGLGAGHGEHLALGTASISILGFERHNGEVPALCLWNAPAGTVLGP